MTTRPLSVTLIGWLFIVAGTIGFVYHLSALFNAPGLEGIMIQAIRVLAIVGGIFLLRGADWARWLLVLWIAYHLILSFMHSVSEILVHLLLFLVVIVFLTRPEARAFFRSEGKTSR
jgi:hypothetical protein